MAQPSDRKHTEQIETVVLQELDRLGPCTFCELLMALPAYTWNEVFLAVDQGSRDGRLQLKKKGPFDYLISVSKSLPSCNISLTQVSNQ